MRFDRLKAQRDRRAFSAEEKVLEFWGNQFPLKSKRSYTNKHACLLLLFEAKKRTIEDDDDRNLPRRRLRLSLARGGGCLLYTSPSPRDLSTSRMPSSA